MSDDVKTADDAETPEAETDAADTAATTPEADASPDVDENETEDAEASDGDDGEDDAPRKRKRPGRLERRMARLEAENAAYQRLLNEREQAKAPETPKPAAKPKMDDFDTLEDFTEALTDWKLDNRITQEREKSRERQAETAKQRQARETAERQKAWLDKGDAAVPGFAEMIADADDVPVTATMADALTEAENGHAAALYLVEHPEEAARIAGLTPTGQAMAIASLAAKTTLPGRKRSKTPPPAKTLGGASAATSDPAKMTPEQYYAHRMKSLQAAS